MRQGLHRSALGFPPQFAAMALRARIGLDTIAAANTLPVCRGTLMATASRARGPTRGLLARLPTCLRTPGFSPVAPRRGPTDGESQFGGPKVCKSFLTWSPCKPPTCTGASWHVCAQMRVESVHSALALPHPPRVQYKDKDTGENYYHNHLTKATQVGAAVRACGMTKMLWQSQQVPCDGKGACCLQR